MAFVPTDFADVTARSVYLGALANASAIKESPLLMSGYVQDARNTPMVKYVPDAGVVRFPVFTYDAVSYALPVDGSAVGTSLPATLTYADTPIVRRIVPYRWMTSAINESIIGAAAFLKLVAETVGSVLSNDIEMAIMAAAITEATNAGRVYEASGVLSYSDVISAVTTHFGSTWRGGNNFAILASPVVYGQLLNDSNVIRAQSSSVSDLSGVPLPSLLGMPIIPTDYANMEVVDTTDVYSTLIVPRDSLKSYIGDVRETAKVHIPGSDTEHVDYIGTYAVNVGSGYKDGALLITSDGPTTAG